MTKTKNESLRLSTQTEVTKRRIKQVSSVADESTDVGLFQLEQEKPTQRKPFRDSNDNTPVQLADPGPIIAVTEPVNIDGQSLAWLSSGRPEIIGVVELNTNAENRQLVELNKQSELIVRDAVVAKLNSLSQDKKQIITSAIANAKTDIDTFISTKQSEEKVKSDARKAFDLTQLGDEFIQFFSRLSGFSKSQIQNFSETKILLQLVNDLYYYVISRSPNYLSEIDSDRYQFLSSTSIDTTYQESFISPKSLDLDVYQNDTFGDSTKLLNKLPRTTADRIKLLINLVVKELVISSNLGNQNKTRPIISYFGDSQNNLFEKIFGIVPNNVLENPIGSNSLASLFSFKPTNNTTILPFESKVIKKENNIWLPGYLIFIDRASQVPIGSKYKIDDIAEYSNKFSSTKSNVANSINSMLSFGNFDPILFLESIFPTFETQLTNSEKLVLAVFSAALNDVILNDLLFQFVAKIAIYKNITISPKTNKSLLETLDDANRIADRIEKRIATIIGVDDETAKSIRENSSISSISSIKSALIDCVRLDAVKSNHPVTIIINSSTALTSLTISSRTIDGTEKTRFNGIPRSTMFWLFFQLMISTIKTQTGNLAITVGTKGYTTSGEIKQSSYSTIVSDYRAELDIFNEAFDYLSKIDSNISMASSQIQNKFRNKIKQDSLPTTQMWLLTKPTPMLDYSMIPTTTTGQVIFVGVPTGFSEQNSSESTTEILTSIVEIPKTYKIKIFRTDPIYDKIEFFPIEQKLKIDEKTVFEETLFDWVYNSTGISFNEESFVVDSVQPPEEIVKLLPSDIKTSAFYSVKSPLNILVKNQELMKLKLFDRIIAIYVDNNMFEINKDRIESQAQLEEMITKEIVYKTQDGKFVLNNKTNNIVFCNYFVTLEVDE